MGLVITHQNVFHTETLYLSTTSLATNDFNFVPRYCACWLNGIVYWHI